MSNEQEFRICVLPGDGIGHEVITSALAVLEAAQARVGGFRLSLDHQRAGAEAYRDTGTAMADEVWASAEASDAILLGAMGLPDVRYPDGTEIAPQLDLRFNFNLYAGVRPIKAMAPSALALADPRAREIDFVLIRESTEGLFASRGKGVVDDDQVARDTSERLFDFAFALARRRREQGHAGKLTLVDKANVFLSFAFMRKIFDEKAAQHPDIDTERLYVDATALFFLSRPWDFDVLVTENMFGDILSDLAAGLVGGMGFAPSADIGDKQAVFQPAHGTAPDIAGQGKANPTATIQSAAMMLEWLGQQHDLPAASEAAAEIDAAMNRVIGGDGIKTFDMGGSDGTAAVTKAVIAALGA